MVCMYVCMYVCVCVCYKYILFTYSNLTIDRKVGHLEIWGTCRVAWSWCAWVSWRFVDRFHKINIFTEIDKVCKKYINKYNTWRLCELKHGSILGHIPHSFLGLILGFLWFDFKGFNWQERNMEFGNYLGS